MRRRVRILPIVVLFGAVCAGCSSSGAVELLESSPVTYEVRTEEKASERVEETNRTTPPSTRQPLIRNIDVFCGLFTQRIDRLDVFLASTEGIYDPAAFEEFSNQHVRSMEEMRPYVPAEIADDFDASLRETQADHEVFAQKGFDTLEIVAAQPNQATSDDASLRVQSFTETNCDTNRVAPTDPSPAPSNGTAGADAEALTALLETESGRNFIVAELAQMMGVSEQAAACVVDRVDIAKLTASGSDVTMDADAAVELLDALQSCGVPLSTLGGGERS